MKYAVALLNFFDNSNHVTIVDSDNPIRAMVEGARTLMRAKDADEWLNGFLKDMPTDSYATRIDEIQDAFFDVDLAISEPVPIGVGQ